MGDESREKIIKRLQQGLKRSPLFARHLHELLFDLPGEREKMAAGGRAGGEGIEAIIAKFAQEANGAKAKVCRARSGDDALGYIAGVAKEKGAKMVARWSEDLPLAEMIDSSLTGLDIITPESINWQYRIAEADIGLTGSDHALAETGSIVLIAGPGKPSSASLIPPIHIALVRQNSILTDLGELFAAIQNRAGGDLLIDQHINIITGPSRTGDIEQTLTLGAHGPKEVHLIILPDL